MLCMESSRMYCIWRPAKCCLQSPSVTQSPAGWLLERVLGCVGTGTLALILVHGDNLRSPDLILQYRLSPGAVRELEPVKQCSPELLSEWRISSLVEPKARRDMLHINKSSSSCCACSDRVCAMRRTAWLYVFLLSCIGALQRIL